MPIRSGNEIIDHFSRIRTAVDVITDEHLHDVVDWMRDQAFVDGGEHLAQQIDTPMDVANGIDAGAVGDSWFCLDRSRRQNVPCQGSYPLAKVLGSFTPFRWMNKSSHVGLPLESKRILACDNIDPQDLPKPWIGYVGRLHALCPSCSCPYEIGRSPIRNNIFNCVRGGAFTTLTNGSSEHHNSYRWTERLLLWPKASPTVAAVIIAVVIPSKPALMKPRNRSVSKDAAPAVA
jgi:hypothetical protein